ncbi:unnamed protein product [Mytilus edulis]|uniref:Uncharacterized protein n=1 Tax=Mytilus edulis TaxID=6550 RepID=A0A8S3QVY1_MYTED|nr:unnamed protein product [Mytilus edulis]
MVDITIHQNAVDSDDIYNVLPFCIAVCDHTERENLPLEFQDGVGAIDNVEVYFIESGEGTCAQCDGKPVGTIVGRVAEGIVTCMHMNVRDGVIGFQVHQCHLVGLGFLELQYFALELDQDLNVNGRLFQPLGLVTHINDKQWVQIDEIGGVNVAVADKTVHVEVVFQNSATFLYTLAILVCVKLALKSTAG